MYRDDAVSEVVGFSLILGMVILSLGLLSVHAAPQITEDLEYSQNDNVLRQFAAFKYDLDLFLAAENTGVYGRTVFTFVPEQTSLVFLHFKTMVLITIRWSSPTNLPTGMRKIFSLNYVREHSL